MNKINGDNYEKYVLDFLKSTGNIQKVTLWREFHEKLLFEHGMITNYDEYTTTRRDIGIDVVGLKVALKC